MARSQGECEQGTAAVKFKDVDRSMNARAHLARALINARMYAAARGVQTTEILPYLTDALFV